MAGTHSLIEFRSKAITITINHSLAKTLLDWPAGFINLGGADGFHVGELFDHCHQRVVVIPTAVVDQIETEFDLFFGDSCQRENLAGMHDR